VAEIKPIVSDHSGTWHRERFAEFARAKAAIGEPTPHMRVVDHLSRDVDDQERVWRAGAYLAAYSVLTGEAIWSAWPWTALGDEDMRARLLPWLQANWGGVHTRRPRRCVRTPEKFYRCLLGYADWERKAFPLLRAMDLIDPREEYDVWWDSVTEIPFFGRYIAIRALELFRRWGYMSAHLYDIRAVGAHSPIRCLMLLRPDCVGDLMTGEPGTVDRIGGEVKTEFGLDMSWFTYATLLCEYRSAYEDRNDFAGHQIDEELSYATSRYADHWRARGFESQLLAARAAVHPVETLGEVQGWQAMRRTTEAALRNWGIVWSDLDYDWHATIAAGRPILRSELAA